MKPGAVFLTLHPLPLPPSVEEANMIRKRVGLPECEDASFYNVKEYELSGTGLLSWTNKSFVIYKYTRASDAVFMCCNPQCKKNMQSMSAWCVNQDNVLCVQQCECGVSERASRNKKMYKCPRHEIHVE
jgi:hypothetical protein